MHLLDQRDALTRKAAPLQAFCIEATHLARVAFDHHERRHVLRDAALETRHRMRADLAELVHTRQPTDDDPIADLHMPGQRRVVGQDGVAAELHVMRDVHIGHHPVVVAHTRAAAVLHSAAVEGAELANRVAVADDQLGRLAAVLHVLRRATDGGMAVDAVVAADRRRPFDHAVRANRAAAADLHAGADDCVGTDLDITRQLCARVDQRGRVELGHQARRRTVHISSASTAVWPSTLARVLYL